MHLVDRDRHAPGVGLAPELAVRRVAPDMIELRRDDRGRGGAELGGAGERVGLQRQAPAVGADQLVLVGEAGANVGDEDLPDAGVAAQPHGMPPAVPGVEVAHHRDPPGVRRPDREVDAVGALVGDRVRAHLVEEAEVRPLADEVVVHRPEHRPEGIGVGHPPLAAGVPGAVLERLALADGKPALEETGVVPALEDARRLVVQGKGLELGGAVDEGARDELRPRPLYAQDGERVAVRPGHDRFDRRWIERTGGAVAAGLAALDGLLAHKTSPPGDTPELCPVGSGYRSMPHMSSAYCRIVRSDENHPMRAVLRMAFSHQADGSAQSASTSRCAAA